MEQPAWPLLELHEVDDLLRQYPKAGGALAILSHSPRPFSSACLVATPRGTAFVKRHPRAVRGHEGLLEEHRFIEHLARAFAAKAASKPGAAVCPQSLVQPPLRDRFEETVVCLGDWTYEVHPHARGLDAYEQVLSWQPFQSSGHALAAGRALAQLHEASNGFSAPPRPTQQLVSSFTIFADLREFDSQVSPARLENEVHERVCARMEGYLNPRPLLRSYAEDRKWRESMQELFLPLYRELLPWQGYLVPLWTHNDFHASNLMWSSAKDEAEVTSIVDFGLADRTNAIHDLATAIERNIVEWLRMDDVSVDLVHFDHLTALLEGYESLSPLSYEQTRALAAMLPLVHCEFALSETDYFLAILGSEEKAFLAYESYFLGHAQWFLSIRGQALLAWLRDRAETHRPIAGADH